MNKQHYRPKTISIFDTVGSFFINEFYNDHFKYARTVFKNNKASSITDAYKQTMLNYVQGVTSDRKCYIAAIKKFHAYYQKNRGDVYLPFCDFEDCILKEFIPDKYYRDFSGNHKDTALNEIVVKIVVELGRIYLEPSMIQQCVNNRHASLVTEMQDRVIELMIAIREDYYARFASQILDKNAPTFDARILDNLKRSYLDEKKRNKELEAELDRAKSIIRQLLEYVEEKRKTAKSVPSKHSYPAPAKKLHSMLPQEDAKLSLSEMPSRAPSKVPSKVPSLPKIPSEVPSEVPSKMPTLSKLVPSETFGELSFNISPIASPRASPIASPRASPTASPRASSDSPRASSDSPRASSDSPRASSDSPRASNDSPRASSDSPRTSRSTSTESRSRSPSPLLLDDPGFG